MPSPWDNFVDEHPRMATFLAGFRSCLPPINFITLHYAYFILVTLVASVIFWGSSNPAFSIGYIDSLFLVMSAMTEAGLNTVNLSQMTTWQQTILFLLIIFGSSIWVSIWTVLFRKRVFEQRFDAIVKADRVRRLNRPPSHFSLRVPLVRGFSLSFSRTQSTPPLTGGSLPATGARISPPGTAGIRSHSAGPAGPDPRPSVKEAPEDGALASRAPPLQTGDSTMSIAHVVFADDPHPNAAAGQSVSTAYQAENRPVRRNGAARGRGRDQDQDQDQDPHSDPEKKANLWHAPNFLTNRTVGRNAQFHNLSTEEREQLGGCEYRALKVLSVIVPLYFFLWQLLGCIALGAWVHNNLPGAATGNGLNPWWVGVFDGASAFNNSGMSLLDANVIPFENAYFVLITMGLMILAGNTAYPVFLRLIIWTMLKVLRWTTSEQDFSDTKATLEFILKYPRRVYTNLFPSRPTWWLVFMLVLLNCIDWVAFELLNLGNPVIDAIPTGARVLDGLFQALAVRSGGFYVVPISSVYIGLQVLYVLMMYISVYPVVITMRHSNVYEERSLGIYADDPKAPPDLEEGVTSTPLQPQQQQQQPLHAAVNEPTMATAMAAANHQRTASSSSMRPVNRISGAFSRSETALELGRALQRTFVPWHGVGVPPPPSPVYNFGFNVGSGGGGGGGGNSGGGAESRISFITQQIHGQLAHDLWWLVLAVLVITTIETSHFLADPVAYSVFNVIFEVVSAYGCVGISVGAPAGAAYSFSGGWHGASKLVLCVVMLRGRHRGLPVALDRAVRLPAEQLHRDEEEDHRIRQSVTSRRMSFEPPLTSE